jgi:hypothetical protein
MKKWYIKGYNITADKVMLSSNLTREIKSTAFHKHPQNDNAFSGYFMRDKAMNMSCKCS